MNGRREFANKLAEAITTAATRAADKAREWYQKEISGLKGAATEAMTVADLLAGKPGRVFMTVPGVKNSDRFLPGGDLLAESDGTKVKVPEARGNFQRVMSEIAETGCTIPVSSLGEEKLDLGKRLPEDVFRHCLILHTVLRRGVAEAQKETNRQKRVAKFQAEADAEREMLTVKATVPPLKGLSTNDAGTAPIYLGRKPWVVTDRSTQKETSYFEVFFLFERNTEGKVRIAEYPERLKPLFGDRFSEFTDPGERFEGLKYPLGSMFRTAYAYEKAKADFAAEEARKLALKAFAEAPIEETAAA